MEAHLKFTPEGGSISVQMYKQESEVEIHVKDSGVGISQEKVESLFIPGDNMSSKGTNHEIGTGLGLMICKEFIALNKGSIKVESEIEKGSTFIVKLPLSDSNE